MASEPAAQKPGAHGGDEDRATPGGLRYFPVPESPYRLSLGLQVLDPADWFEIDDDLARDLAHKQALLAERRDVIFRAVPESTDLQAVAFRHVADHLLTRHRDIYSGTPDAVHVGPTGQTVRPDPAAPLMSTAALVQEDIAIMAPGPDGFRLVAAMIAFPTRWHLGEKIGKALREIHAPVPGYDRSLARPMDRMFAGLRPGRLLWRANYSLLQNPALHQPGGHSVADTGQNLVAETLGHDLWFRVERQTISVLPDTDAVIFTVRIHRARLQDVAHSPERAAAMLHALDTTPADMKLYKSLPGFEDPLREWLSGRAGRPPNG